jgi:hypothetical protein
MNNEQISDKIEDVVFHGLVMRSVPERTLREFKKLAKEEFDNHYGITLRELMDHYFEYKLIKELLLNSNINITKLIEEANKK